MRTTLIPLVAFCALTGSSLAFAQATSHSAPAYAATSHESQQMHESMMTDMQKMQDVHSTGDIDKDFAMMMRLHHQQAVDMAKLEIKHGKSPELKAMAQKIVNDQQKEISILDKWLASHK